MIFTVELPLNTATSIPTSCSYTSICQVASQQENWSVYPAHCIHVLRVLSTLAGGCCAAEMMMEKVRVSVFIVSLGAVVHFRTLLCFFKCSHEAKKRDLLGVEIRQSVRSDLGRRRCGCSG